MKEDMIIDSSADWADLKNSTLYIRDKKLLSLIKESDFIDVIYHFWLHKKPSENEKRMLNALLVSFCGGWSIIPPVVFSARLAATTKAPMAQCLAAGFSASGPAHTSAIEGIMGIYLKTDIKDIDDLVQRKLEGNEKLPGFGHPVLARDPRPAVLRELCEELGVAGDAVKKYDRIQSILNEKKGIYGNIDAIAGAVLVDLGFEDPGYGPAFFLMGRSLSMTAHILEEYKNKPFRALNLVYPGFEQISYNYTGKLER